jgi:hypothetical protein
MEQLELYQNHMQNVDDFTVIYSIKELQKTLFLATAYLFWKAVVYYILSNLISVEVYIPLCSYGTNITLVHRYKYR